jgi:hypothetical protein
MAIYVPRARRRRNTILVGVAGLVVGVVLGIAAGRSSAPTIEDRVKSVRGEAGAIASQLRVVSLHEESGAASFKGGGDAGAELALRRTETNLRALFRRAPWVTTKASGQLIADTTALQTEAPKQANTEEFSKQVNALADKIEATFGG